MGAFKELEAALSHSSLDASALACTRGAAAAPHCGLFCFNISARDGSTSGWSMLSYKVVAQHEHCNVW